VAHHPLVVLSACQTGLGKVFDGGSYGVARGWLSAGAGQVVASLWRVSDEATKILPKGYTVDYTGESRQLRSEGNKFLPAFLLAVVLIFLVLAAQFNSFRDPFVILAGSVPLAMFGALLMTFLKMPNPNMPFWTDGWTTTLNVYSQDGLVTLVPASTGPEHVAPQPEPALDRHRGAEAADRANASREPRLGEVDRRAVARGWR